MPKNISIEKSMHFFNKICLNKSKPKYVKILINPLFKRIFGKFSKINNILLLFFDLYILTLKAISQNYIFLIFWKYIFINFDTFLKTEIFIYLE